MRCADKNCKRVLWCLPCGLEERVERPHRRERFYVGPKTAEIVLDLIRAKGTGLLPDYAIELRIRRHLCGEQPTVTLRPYATEDGTFYFRMEGEFMSDPEKFPRGFYIGNIYWDDCLLDSIEIVKAPGVYIGDAMATSDQCVLKTDYKEPECPKPPECPPPPEHLQSCDCAECRRRKKHYLMKRTPKANYITDLSGLFEDSNGSDGQ